jgi:hypothetical protein
LAPLSFLFLLDLRETNYYDKILSNILSFQGDFHMSSRKFKFVSPGIFLNEIDNSQLPKISDAIGPVIIGNTPAWWRGR